MWFELEGPSYVMLLSVLVILAAFALLVFGTLPCSCKYIFMLRQICFWKHQQTRVGVGHNNRRHVIGSGGVDNEESLPGYPGVPGHPFSQSVSSPQPGGVPGGGVAVESYDSSRRVGGLTFLALAPLNLHYSLSSVPRGAKSDWDELPPSYDSLFPTAKLPFKEGPATTEL